MGYAVSLSRMARRDISDIVRHISTDSPKRAVDFGQLLVSKAKSVGDSPRIGRMVPELEDEDIREIIVRPYRIIYRVNHKAEEIEIIRFWHGKRGTPELLS